MLIQTTFVGGISPWPPYVPTPKIARVRHRRKSVVKQPGTEHSSMRQTLMNALKATARYQSDLIADTGFTARQITKLCTACDDIFSERVVYEGLSNVIYWIKSAPPPLEMRSHTTQGLAIIAKKPWMQSSELPWERKENQRVMWLLEQNGDLVSRYVVMETKKQGIRPVKQYKVSE